MEGLQELTNVLSNGTIPTHYGLWPPLPRVCGFATQLPLLSQEQVKLRTSNLRYIYRANPNKSPLKFWRKGNLGVSRDCPNFWVPLLSQERVKVRTSYVVETFKGSIGTKAHKMLGIVAVGVSGSNDNFQGTHLQGALHGHFCDSTAFLLLLAVAISFQSSYMRRKLLRLSMQPPMAFRRHRNR